MGPGSQILAFTYSSSDLGWMYKDSFEPVKEEIHNTVSWWLVWILIRNEVSLYSQHIQGSEKIIAESLSRDFHISYQPLTNIFNFVRSPHTAASYHIKSHPREIIFWIFSLAASSTWTKESPKPLRPSSLETEICGALSLHTQASRINSWTEFHKEAKQLHCHHLLRQYKVISMSQWIHSSSSAEHSNPPYWMYMHPSRRIFGATRT